MVIVGAHWRAEKEMRQLEVHLGKMGIRIPALPLYVRLTVKTSALDIVKRAPAC